MPTVLRVGPFRLHFYSNEGTEPPHIHVEKDDLEVKFWLDPVSIASNKGFKLADLRKVEKIIFQNHSLLLEKYNEFHNR